ncbi:tetratricopeptide repeat protein [Novosphingobium lindaniclasticum]|uniref:Ancillary SecYEG translocon subunit n=1 Tax=Novosphingobium lindaniclasticum LE124 TaxID=1096930 RepID=T0HUM7_9SPHN|nr:tetratricopeptide repeat protein [Novosphingobium lindaniclasticum]EQB15828.1 hypothetical protein L284_10485 [Novosphingobium lindaniclasticum LE124]
MALPPSNSTPTNPKSAERLAAQQDVFLREVDDALRQDQMEGFFTRYGKPLIAAIVLALVAFGGWLYWNHRQNQQRDADAEAYVQAIDSMKSGNLDAAKGKLEAIAKGSGGKGSAASAKLMLAGIAAEQKRLQDAVKLYDEVANDAKAPQPLRDLAAVRGVAANFDGMKPEDVVARLKPYAAPGNPWFGVAGEMVGMAYIKMNKQDQAGPLFAAIAKDEQVESGLRSRARQLAAVLGVDAIDDVVDERGEPLGKTQASAQPAPVAGE